MRAGWRGAMPATPSTTPWRKNIPRMLPRAAPRKRYGTILAEKTCGRRAISMPEKKTLERAHEDARKGKALSTQAGEFVREEIEHIRKGNHGARSAKQAIAIGLSKARRAGIDLPAPKKGTASEKTRTQSHQTASRRAPSPTRSRASTMALQHEGRQAASHTALSRQAHASARSRGAADRRRAAQKAVRTKGKAGLRSAARKAARTRMRAR